MCAGYITASLCTWNYRRMWFFKWSFDRSRCIMPTNRSLTHWWSPIDHSYQRVHSRERPENLPCPARANSASPARTHTDNRAIPGSPLCPNPWWCAVVLWSESGFFFFFGFSFEQWRRKFKGVNQWFFIEQRGHTEFGSFFFSSPKISLVKKGKKWEVKSRNIWALKLIFFTKLSFSSRFVMSFRGVGFFFSECIAHSQKIEQNFATFVSLSLSH